MTFFCHPFSECLCGSLSPPDDHALLHALLAVQEGRVLVTGRDGGAVDGDVGVGQGHGGHSDGAQVHRAGTLYSR